VSENYVQTTELEAPTLGLPKEPFDIDVVLGRIRKAVAPFAPAAMFELADEGFDSLFEQLVACIISTRTRDESTVVIARELFNAARTPHDIADLSVADIDRLIRASTFHGAKAPQIQQIARRVRDEFGGDLPADAELLMSLPGVGPKCANLALGVATGQARISVDVHVDRITNRWGYVQTRSPEETMDALEKILPREYWIEINRLLVPFGKHVCTGPLPACSTCPVLSMCRQVGVTRHH
jgi:endonuclease-3